jgi:hypothetical protein
VCVDKPELRLVTLLLAVDNPVDTEAIPVEADELKLVTLLLVVLKPVETDATSVDS